MKNQNDNSKNGFFFKYFLKVNLSFTITHTNFKFCLLILHIHPEGTVSQIFNLGLSFHFMTKIEKLFEKFHHIIF